MSDAPGAINFTMFLTLFGERLQGTDPEDVIKNAFGCFDEENQVRIPISLSFFVTKNSCSFKFSSTQP